MEQKRVSFFQAISWALSYNYFDFDGRSSRSEYWWFSLFCFIISWGIIMPVGILTSFGTAYDIVKWVINLALLLPSWGLTVRRLHDTDRSGWNILWLLLPIVGMIILIIYLCKPSEMEDNQYGDVPNVD